MPDVSRETSGISFFQQGEIMSGHPVIRLKKNEERRLKSGHLWIFSNEIEAIQGSPENGSLVHVVTQSGSFLGTGLYSKHSLIAVRLVSLDERISLKELVPLRIRQAQDRRVSIGLQGSYRLIHGESDFLSGLVVDRYENCFVVESYTAGMDSLMEIVVSALDAQFRPERIIEKSDSMWRSYESLDTRVRMWKGDEEDISIGINGVQYMINPKADQKTGLFLDQAMNRMEVETLAQGKNVLDCFCNVGGFAMHAARGGATHIDGVDISGLAVARARRNAALNGLNNIRFHESDVFDFMQRNTNAYDLIVLDPPAFVKSRKSVAVGLKAYRKINEMAMQALKEGGILVSCSCSHHVTTAMFLDMLASAATRQRKQLLVRKTTGAGPDHPVLLAMPETEYLTCVFAQVISWV
jgi:23S rRNA (cytosine1962-C5)-methyltransferase